MAIKITCDGCGKENGNVSHAFADDRRPGR
jgi:hypothetical protein